MIKIKIRNFFQKRINNAIHPLTKKLFQLMEIKKTNLALAIDVTNSSELLYIADKIGPEICLLKTHVDILKDFSTEVTKKLSILSAKHKFLIFEDRKFSDIGNTIQMQYKEGIYKIFYWADIVNSFGFSAQGIIDILKKEKSFQKKRGILLISEMSNKNYFFSKKNRIFCYKLAKKYPDFIMGFICQEGFKDIRFIYLTPGIRFQHDKDDFDQKYRPPEEALIKQNCDILIIGRGILQSKNLIQETKKYKIKCWDIYLRKILA